MLLGEGLAAVWQLPMTCAKNTGSSNSASTRASSGGTRSTSAGNIDSHNVARLLGVVKTILYHA